MRTIRERFYEWLCGISAALWRSRCRRRGSWRKRRTRRSRSTQGSGILHEACVRAVRRRYAEVVDFKEYEAKIQKLIDTHVGTGSVEKITTLVNIFDKDAFLKESEKLEGTASKADTIAHRTKKTINERMEEDPAFYRKFSEMLEDAIRAFREKRIEDRGYLTKVTEIAEAIRTRKDDNLPETIRHRDVAKAFYGVVRKALAATPRTATFGKLQQTRPCGSTISSCARRSSIGLPARTCKTG